LDAVNSRFEWDVDSVNTLYGFMFPSSLLSLAKQKLGLSIFQFVECSPVSFDLVLSAHASVDHFSLSMLNPSSETPSIIAVTISL
jgi:hypothetical protein